MGIASLVADVSSVVDGVLNAFGLSDPSSSYPASLGKLVSNTVVENDRSWRKSLGYSFEVVRVKDGKIIQGPTGPGGDAETWKPFVLQINPQELTQDEIFAIEVTPTFSGVLVEHQGTTLKDIQISGTTGLSPNRREGGAFPQSGRPILAAGHSGYFEFHELRTYFRAYVEQKRNDPGRDEGELRLVWNNLRDHESLFVEPQKFTMKRTASKAMLYDYSIALKGIGIATPPAGTGNWLSALDDLMEGIQDSLDIGVKLIQGGIGFAERVERDITNTLLNPVRSLAAALRELSVGGQRLDRAGKRLNSLPAQAKTITDVGRLITKEDKKAGGSVAGKEFQAKYQAASNQAREAAAAQETNIKEANKTAAAKNAAINKEKIKELADTAQTIYDNMALAAGLPGTVEYLKIKGDTATLVAALKAVPYEEMKTIYATKTVAIALNKMTATDALFKTSLKADQKFVDQLYQDAKSAKEKSANLSFKTDAAKQLYQAQITGDLAAIKTIQTAIAELAQQESIKIGAAAKEQNLQSGATASKIVVISGNDNIQTLAVKYLGSPDKFKDLVLFNSLRPPYIDSTPIEDVPTRAPGVLRPGDKIFIPTRGAPAVALGSVRNNNYQISKNLSEIERSFGIDVMLTDDYDIAISNTGDVKLTAGTNNVAQALIVKLLLESGSLQRHPGIGGGLEIGGKTIDVSDTLLKCRRSLEQDARVQTVIFAEIQQQASTTFINLVLKLKDVDQPISVPVKVA